MRIALVVPGSLWDEPFVRIYSQYLNIKEVEYDIISWNRDGRDKPEGIQYDYNQPLNSNKFAKLLGYLRFALFAKKHIRRKQYDKLILFGPQIGVFLPFLLKKYVGRYIFDYRDLSLEQIGIFRQLFCHVLRNSYANVISSVGFKKALPSDYDYLICHNFNVDMVSQALQQPCEDNWHISTPINVLTIGGIRDYSSNSEVIGALANNSQYEMQFVGRGIASDALETFCVNNHIQNVVFKGFYHKEEEADYIKASTFLNIFYPRKLSHDTALSNRFYNSLIFKRPMIVTKNTTQGDFADQYKVGIALENCNDISDTLTEFLKNDYQSYSKRCNELLKLFWTEQNMFYDKLESFILER